MRNLRVGGELPTTVAQQTKSMSSVYHVHHTSLLVEGAPSNLGEVGRQRDLAQGRALGEAPRSYVGEVRSRSHGCGGCHSGA